jgi:hypothetical protein
MCPSSFAVRVALCSCSVSVSLALRQSYRQRLHYCTERAHGPGSSSPPFHRSPWHFSQGCLLVAPTLSWLVTYFECLPPFASLAAFGRPSPTVTKHSVPPVFSLAGGSSLLWIHLHPAPHCFTLLSPLVQLTHRHWRILGFPG